MINFSFFFLFLLTLIKTLKGNFKNIEAIQIIIISFCQNYFESSTYLSDKKKKTKHSKTGLFLSLCSNSHDFLMTSINLSNFCIVGSVQIEKKIIIVIIKKWKKHESNVKLF